MYSISRKITLVKKALVSKNSFINDETIPSANTTFTCCNCHHENTIEITPYQSGFPISQVYHEDKVVSESTLLEQKIVNRTSQGMSHFGELTVNNLPTLYFGTDCSSCHSHYFCVFSYGEKQPGLTALTISGIWKYE
ncbi:hypothetical protein [Chryseobacterium sp. JK1]|uniref:hypothetical protein n=1 Tax=Chryseobacterium sp. JK1 TaxID=874294 RepID=UPI003D69AF7C